MKIIAFVLALTAFMFIGCSTPSSNPPTPVSANVTNLGTVAVTNGGYYDCTLSGRRNCRVRLTALPEHRVLVEAVVTRTDAQGKAKILARPSTVAKLGQEVSLLLDEGSIVLIPELKLAEGTDRLGALGH
jgi:Flp pilus assembly secretin CpaC